jgi:mono/diheme cytochrome c family protein
MTMNTRAFPVFILSVTTLVSAVWAQSGGVAGQQSAAGAVTFSEHVAPILYANCVSCHRAGEAAPFPLVTYEDAASRGKLLATVTRSRYMPPWQAEAGHVEFAGERRLSDAQIAAIGQWVTRGMLEGDRSKLPPLPTFTDGWQLGQPDLIIEMPTAFEVPADGPDIYRNFAIPTGLTEDKFVRAIEFRPVARKAVHHALFQFARTGSTKEFEDPSGKPGFGGLAPIALLPGFAPSGELGGWAVGATPRFLPEGLALPLAKGSDFILQMHFHPTGKPELEKARIGIYFADRAPDRKLMNWGAPGLFGLLAGIDIPPGEKNFSITGTLAMKVDMRAISVTAHAHYLGKEIKAIATFPDGTTKPLIWIKDWDFNWQDQYAFKEPVVLPKGTRIDVQITYDNSADNPRNPSNPPRRVQWGEESFDEMGNVRFQLVTVNKEDEAVLQQAMAGALKAALSSAVQSGALKKLMEAREKKRKAGGS